MRLSPKNVTWEKKMKVDFGTEEWDMYILTTWSMFTNIKQFKICRKSQSPLTPYVNNVNMQNRHEYISRQKSILLQNLWSSFTLTYVDQPKAKD